MRAAVIGIAVCLAMLGVTYTMHSASARCLIGSSDCLVPSQPCVTVNCPPTTDCLLHPDPCRCGPECMPP